MLASSLARYDPLPQKKKRGRVRCGRGSSQTRKMISFITRILGNVIHGILRQHTSSVTE